MISKKVLKILVIIFAIGSPIYWWTSTYKIERYKKYCQKTDCLEYETKIVYEYDVLEGEYRLQNKTECVLYSDPYTMHCFGTRIVKS